MLDYTCIINSIVKNYMHNKSLAANKKLSYRTRLLFDRFAASYEKRLVDIANQIIEQNEKRYPISLDN